MPETLSPDDKARLIKGFSSQVAVPPTRRFICVIYGNPKTGKSSAAATARRPILWHSFDPGGAESEKVWPHVALKPEDLGGEKYILLNNSFEQEDPMNPSAMLKWAAEFQRLKENKLFDLFGTYVLDSLTMMVEANMNQLLKVKGRELPKSKGWDDNDYADSSNKMKHVIGQMLSINCDIVIIGHPDTTTEELTKKTKSSLMLPGALKQTLPLRVSEYYITDVVNTQGKLTYRLRTKPDGVFDANSRKASLLNEYEEPDLLKIMKKAGYETEHKPY